MEDRFSEQCKTIPYGFSFGSLNVEGSWSLYHQTRAWILTKLLIRWQKKTNDNTDVTWAEWQIQKLSAVISFNRLARGE